MHRDNLWTCHATSVPPEDNDRAVERGTELCNVLDGKAFSLTGLELAVFLDIKQFRAVLDSLGFSYEPRTEDFGRTKLHIGIASGRAGTPQDGTKYKVAVSETGGWFLRVVAVRLLELGNAVPDADRVQETAKPEPQD